MELRCEVSLSDGRSKRPLSMRDVASCGSGFAWSLACGSAARAGFGEAWRVRAPLEVVLVLRADELADAGGDWRGRAGEAARLPYALRRAIRSRTSLALARAASSRSVTASWSERRSASARARESSSSVVLFLRAAPMPDVDFGSLWSFGQFCDRVLVEPVNRAYPRLSETQCLLRTRWRSASISMSGPIDLDRREDCLVQVLHLVRSRLSAWLVGVLFVCLVWLARGWSWLFRGANFENQNLVTSLLCGSASAHT